MELREMCRSVDLHEVASRLGLARPGGDSGNYRSPHHTDSTPSLSIFRKADETRWRDHSTDESGDAIDLVRYVNGSDVAEAAAWMRQEFGFPNDTKKKPQHVRETLQEYIARQCMENTAPAIEYLTGRGIAEDVVRKAIQNGTVGFNDWTSRTRKEGEIGHGGPAAAFIVRQRNPRAVRAVDLRYLDPALNGNVKTMSQGDKEGVPWCSSEKAIQQAKTVIVVESAINALSVETCKIPHTAALATRGTATVRGIDWALLRGRRVLICLDNDEPQKNGRRPGPEAGWAIYEALTALCIPCHLVDQSEWEVNDVNHLLQTEGPEETMFALQRLEPWAIPGVPSTETKRRGRARVWLPSHDFAQYWRFRPKEDFTTYVTEKSEDDRGNEHEQYSDLAAFRIADISRRIVESPRAAMTGEQDTQPRNVFAITVQQARRNNELIRRVFSEDDLHNVMKWGKIATIWQQGPFMRLVNMWERASNRGAISAANFVGLCFLEGKLHINEGPDCYFSEPEKQCPYHNLTFPTGPRANARVVIEAYRRTFGHNAATLLLTWALGAHLKAFLGFWPHMILQADKGAGKSNLTKHLERSIAFTMFSGQSLQTEFRMLTSIGHTSHPVGWEELSARKQETIDKAVALLQESYQYTYFGRGADLTQFLNSAPVLLAGEDVPVRSLLGKVVRTTLTIQRQGDLIPDDVPVFPVRGWLEYLTQTQTRTRVRELHRDAEAQLQHVSRASGTDAGAKRMAGNYAAVLVAWWLLCEFAGIEEKSEELEGDLMREMNGHIADTSGDRAPWVWILESVIAEISAGMYRHPFAFRRVDNEHECLLIRPQHVMHHLKSTPGLRAVWDSLTVKTHTVFRRQMENADVLYRQRIDATINGRRECHLIAISLESIASYGLHASVPEAMEVENPPRSDSLERGEQPIERQGVDA